MHYLLPSKLFLILFLFFFFFNITITMTLNCLTCQVLKRTDSHDELRERINNVKGQKSNNRLFSGGIDRNWSGNLVPKPRFEKTRAKSLLGQENKVKKDSRRIHNSDPMEFMGDTPKLARSSGMRRDWSFEDLRQTIKR
ncbi:hypothetical protein RND71_032359 [Anisodus tanguticus]|uniref:Uncharacterized protein n=1 Tax=Anisodus tanguticus TaxID=243964 RepID=A0AAE1RCI5_9SOLA|nr:hypothetical protein RND71_032359 [Anisodus tanguticus]